MIKEFSIKNYLSFKNNTIFSMEADFQNVSEFKEHIVKIGQDNILKVASLYGPNGAGKSNLLKAFTYFKDIVLFGLTDSNQEEYNLRFILAVEDFEKFSFSDDNDNIIEFKMFFINEQYEIGYELQIENSKDNIVFIKYENMSYRNINEDKFNFLFERKKNKFEMSEDLSKLLLTRDFLISDQITFVAFINELYVSKTGDNPGAFKLIKCFIDEVNNIDYLRSLRNRSMSIGTLFNSFEDKSIKKKTLEIINDLGIDISDIIVERGDDSRTKVYLVRTINGAKYTLDIDKESDGTRSLLYLLPRIIRKIEMGGVLIIDEIDAHLHPKLTKAIIKIFTNKDNHKTQLIFTSHDILNMTNELFRRDEIWFVVKDQSYVSQLIALTDFVNYKGEKVRKDAKYSKQYLEGKYGADPFIQKGVYWHAKNT